MPQPIWVLLMTLHAAHRSIFQWLLPAVMMRNITSRSKCHLKLLTWTWTLSSVDLNDRPTLQICIQRDTLEDSQEERVADKCAEYIWRNPGSAKENRKAAFQTFSQNSRHQGMIVEQKPGISPHQSAGWMFKELQRFWIIHKSAAVLIIRWAFNSFSKSLTLHLNNTC